MLKPIAETPKVGCTQVLSIEDGPCSVLALHGGEKCISDLPVDKWVKVDAAAKDAVMSLLDEGITTIVGNGGIIGEFEAAFAKLVGTRHALTMVNGTSALHSAYFAVGIGPGDEVLVPTYTWHAMITPIVHCGATPVFCDIDASTLTIDPAEIKRKISPRTKAISIVHAFGNVCDMDRITAITREHNLALIEDCSHAHGASWKGQPVGSFGDVGCFSMQGQKAVSGGEAGVVTTNGDHLMDRMIQLGHFGRQKIGSDSTLDAIGEISLGAKYRAHPLAIALANADLKRLAELNRKRTLNYEFLNDSLRDCPGLETIEALPGAQRAGYLEFKFKLSPQVLKLAARERILEAMQAEGVPLQVDRYTTYSFPHGLLHTAPLFNGLDTRPLGGCFYDPSAPRTDLAPVRNSGTLPVAEDLALRLISLHAFADVEESSLEEIAAAMRKVLGQVHQL